MWLELAQRRATCLSASFCRAEMKDCWFAWAWADSECNSLKVATEFDLDTLPVTTEKPKVKGETVRAHLIEMLPIRGFEATLASRCGSGKLLAVNVCGTWD